MRLTPRTLTLLIPTTLLGACGGGSGLEDFFVKAISIQKMECPIASEGATVAPNTNTKVKAWATISGIKDADVIWTWDSDGNAVTIYSQSQTDNTSTLDIKAPGSPAKYKINVHAKAEGKQADATCELEVK